MPHGRTGRGLLAIISGPSGVGKSTITRAVRQQLNTLFSISVTTRPKTAEDADGVTYSFVSQAEFDRRRDAGDFLEWAEVFGHCYGTPRKPVMDAIAAGKIVILEIDVQGAIQIKRTLPHAFGVFILPPDEQTLLQRLRDRKREDESVIQRRFAKAKPEIDLAKTSGAYDCFIVNDDLDTAITQTVDAISDARQA